ncbi:65-kDa microtubule-associated protein 1 [Canna indica]|uniref:65-kDa microtubule-associated protein 1 n=1 Tax=Canna indica TaxID=4628 RepID=A0AAQ3K2K3_9LILI|nr:65-kDa microtubule-associated protein 1 [Canna indica]
MVISGLQDMLIGETTCGSLLQQLQLIWDEIGESDEERDKMLLQLEQECLDVYKRKVDQASKSRALLLQSLADSKAELARLLSALGEKSLVGIPDQSSGTIKEQLAAIAPVVEELCEQKEERVKEFANTLLQIQTIQGEICGTLKIGEQIETPVVDEEDLSLKKLDEYHLQLQELQKEKVLIFVFLICFDAKICVLKASFQYLQSDRLQKVLDLVSTVHDLCAVMGLDFFSTITEVHPSLNDSVGVQSKSISNDTLSELSRMVIALEEDKKMRLQKVQELAAQLTDLWNLMDTPVEEQGLFSHVTCNISCTVDEVTVPGSLTLDLIEQAEVEVERLDQLKASKMKEIAFKKQNELEDIYSRAHIEIDSTAARDKILAIIDSGNFESSELLAEMDNQILKAKEEAASRKDILERVEKWMSACEEESWLEDYNRDDNRYNSSRGAHLNLKRAEKARILVNKIPALVDMLVAKTRAWEENHDMSFMYDGVSLLAMLDEYNMLRQDREEEKRRQRDQKRFHEQLTTEQEAIFGSRPSPVRSLVPKKVISPRSNGNTQNGNPSRRLSLNSGPRSASRDGKRDSGRPAAPVNYVSIAKEDATSPVMVNDQVASSP